jgi:hypothetical protein
MKSRRKSKRSSGTKWVAALFILNLIGLGVLAIQYQSPVGQRGIARYAGDGNVQAKLRFRGTVGFKSTESNEAVLEEEARDKIEEQLKYVFGPWQFALRHVKISPKKDHSISNIEVKRVNRKEVEAGYDYVGTIVINNVNATTAPVYLPIRPDTIYAEAKNVSRGNHCTDSHYTSEGDFWYFWSPSRDGCKLRRGDHYYEFTGQVETIPNTIETYPEYERLVRDGQSIPIWIFLGLDVASNGVGGRDQHSYSEYQQIQRHLLANGFKLTFESPRSETRYRRLDYVKEASRAKLEVKIHYGATSISERDGAFFRQDYREALANGSVVIYNGHSGLGGNLSLTGLQYADGIRPEMPVDRYQLFVFNGCTTYTYYNTQYFMRKATSEDPAGTKNLDILTNGIEGFFDGFDRVSMNIVDAVTEWADGGRKANYQTMLRRMNTSSYLTGINGDEDNPTKP